MIYNGTELFTNNFNLYAYDNINFQNSKKDILHAFETEYKDEIQATLARAGLEFVSLEYYSPKQYNFEGDSIDIKLNVKDKATVEKYIEANKKELQALLDGNKSYDGYMALTPENTDGLIDSHGDVSIVVLQHILQKVETADFSIHDYMEIEHMCYECHENEVLDYDDICAECR